MQVPHARDLLSKLPNRGNRDSHIDPFPLPLQCHLRRQDLPPGNLPPLAIASIGRILGVTQNPQGCSHYFTYQLNSKAKTALATYRCLAPRRIPPLAIAVILEVAAPARPPPRRHLRRRRRRPPLMTADPQGGEGDPGPKVPVARAARMRGAR